MAKAKYVRIAERLGQRIRQGDYHLNALPSERRLAGEAGVSMMTARKAVQKLVEDGLLDRAENGRLQIRHDSERVSGLRQLAMLVPAFDSVEVQSWQNVIVRTAPGHGCAVRMVTYSHWDDPTLMRTLNGFGGSFFLPIPGTPPQGAIARIAALEKPVVIINHDWSEYGLPSLRLYPLSSVQMLLDHLQSLGRTRIACFNVQPEDPVVLGRIGQWQMWMARHRLDAPLIHEPVEPFTETLPAAVRIARRLLDEQRDAFDAVLCVTEAAAVGLIRAMVDAGLRPGRDLPVCAVNSQIGPFTVPTITSLSHPDAATLVATCLRWMNQTPPTPWIGPLLIEPHDLKVVPRESTLGLDLPR